MTEVDEFGADAGVREILKRNRIVEAHRLVAEYKCHRTRADGEPQVVCVRIYDMGPDNPNARYSWDVSVPDAECPEPVSANPADSIITAGLNPHWNLLDADARKGQ